MTNSVNCTTLVVFLIFLTVSIASANMTVKKYIEYKNSPDSDTRDVIGVYMRGVKEGISWTNAYLKAENYQVLFCPPETPALSTKDYTDILDNIIEQYRKIHDDVDNQYIEPILLRGLERTFPCKE